MLALFGAHAQDADAPDADAAKHCRQLSDGVARLSCYDAAFGVSTSPRASQPAAQNPQQPAPISSQNIPQAPRAQADGEAQFGDVGQLHRNLKSKDQTPRSITARVKAATATASGTYRVSLDNGQVWRTTLADWAVAFSAGDMVTISRLPLGGHQISSEGTTRSVGVVRIQ